MSAVAQGGAGWPHGLDDLGEPPARLHVRPPGDAARLAAAVAEPAVAIVGGRRADAPSRAFARRLASDLAGAGVAVVSGLAAGIDAAAHEGALAAGGRTVAVLGCGVDIDYPRANAPLAAQIAARGAVVSEYGAGTAPAPWRFPARNRIVAALAGATVVICAGATSGALITARLALELGREVLVVPGPAWEEGHRGGNALLRDGALPACEAADVLVALGLDPGVPRAGDAVDAPDAARLLACVRRAAGDAATLGGRTGLVPARLLPALAELELLGLVVVDARGVVHAA